MSITLRGELSQSRNADIRAMETRNCTALVTTVGIIMKGMRMMARSEMAGKTISGVSSCPRMWYRRSTTAIMTGGVASLMNDVSTRQTCTPLRYCSSMSRFASMFAMKRGSHVINFAMRIPEKNSFVAFTRASVVVARRLRSRIMRRITSALSGSVVLRAATATSALHPTSRYKRKMENTATIGELQRYMQNCRNSSARSTSVLTI
ncbi:hypothetical protein C3747_360g33 [Trypanosoma cruzi]|uniref:Uncharacterized protein n=1 Tax=Trypanosoma cruzi TaxID=5693 RepID=A0A2V2V1Z6_TRYCR|nr:hypothetical protein C3747_360g33 [Trypanosoma cruzi]